MTDEPVATFEDALEELDVGSTRVGSDRFEAALEDAIEPPAVGAPLPFDGVTLPDAVTRSPTPDELREANTGVTAAGAGIAAYGTLVIQSRPGGDEPVSLYPERHVAVVRASDVVPDLSGAMEWLAGEFDAGRDTAVLATGISATADMGATVYGVHGPRSVHAIIVSDR